MSDPQGPVDASGFDAESVERFIELIRSSGVTISMHEMAERLGMGLVEIEEIQLASGLEPIDADVPRFIESDIEAMAVFKTAATLFSWDELVAFTRVMGSSVSRITDAATSLFATDVELPRRAAGIEPLELARLTVRATELSDQLASVMTMLMRLHMDQSVRRSRQSRDDDDLRITAPMSVGFIDLVGFTTRSRQMRGDELAEFVLRFEAMAHDTVTALHGRLVKLIGDEVMYVAVDPTDGCRIAEALLATFSTDPALTPRGGLAYGEVLSRGGDFFGATVNLAARLVDQAVPGEVLMTEEAAAHSHRPYLAAGRRMLKGFEEPIAVVSLTID